MNTYRVATNGLKFRIQARSTKGWWRWKREVWIDLGVYTMGGYFDSSDYTYNTLKEAQKICDRLNDEAARLHEWRAVSPNS